MYCIQKVLKFNELTFFIFHKLYLFTIPPMAEEDASIKPVPILAAWAYDPIPEEDALDTKELNTQSFIWFAWVKATNADKRCSKA